MIKAAILDFDGTLVTHDILSVISRIVGKEEESIQINNEFHQGKRKGIEPLIERINFLKGVTLSQIETLLNQNPYLMPGSTELMKYFKDNNIITILSSGSILPILYYYQKILSFNYIVGSKPRIENDIICGISKEDFSGPDFKIEEVKKILEELDIKKGNVLAIGDSPADKKIFEYSEISIAINPKEGIEKNVNYVIYDNLREAIQIIRKYLD